MKRYVRLWSTYSFSCQDVADGVQEANCVSHLYNGGKISPLQLRPNLRFWNFRLVLSSGFRTIHDSKLCCLSVLIHTDVYVLFSRASWPLRLHSTASWARSVWQRAAVWTSSSSQTPTVTWPPWPMWSGSPAETSTNTATSRLACGSLHKESSLEVAMSRRGNRLDYWLE